MTYTLFTYTYIERHSVLWDPFNPGRRCCETLATPSLFPLQFAQKLIPSSIVFARQFEFSSLLLGHTKERREMMTKEKKEKFRTKDPFFSKEKHKQNKTLSTSNSADDLSKSFSMKNTNRKSKIKIPTGRHRGMCRLWRSYCCSAPSNT